MRRRGPLSILFPREGPGIADYYFKAPASRASNRLLADAVAATVANWPEGRRLRIVEVGAGTGSGTSVVLPELPDGDFDYMFTDISAGLEVFATASPPKQAYLRSLGIEHVFDSRTDGYGQEILEATGGPA